MPKRYPAYEGKQTIDFSVDGKIIEAKYAFDKNADLHPCLEGQQGNVEAMPHIHLQTVEDTIRTFRLLQEQRYLGPFNGEGHERRKFFNAYSRELTPDVTHSWLLSTLEGVQQGPLTYDELKEWAEITAKCFTPDDFRAGKLDVDTVLQQAIAAGEIEHTGDRYAITDEGKREAKVVHERIMALG